MIDHFGWMARFYDRLIPSADPRQMLRLLDLPADGPLLDAGGGTGRVLARVAEYVPLAVVSDISRPMLRHAVRRNLVAIQARNEALPFADNVFARVLITDALHHFGDQGRVLDEIVRTLRPGGRIVIEEPDIRQPPVKLVALLERLAGMGSRFYPPDRIAGRLRRRGLEARVEVGRRFSAWIWAEKAADLDRKSSIQAK